MPTPNQAYVSNQVPFGGFFIKVYRNQSSPTQLGSADYILETASPTDEVVEGDRPGTDGGDNGFWLVNGKTEGPAVIQLASASTPTLKNGDFFKCSLFSTDSAGAGEARYFVIKSTSPTIGTNDYRKQSVTLREEKFPSVAQQAITEASN
jgi:hypothetical protein